MAVGRADHAERKERRINHYIENAAKAEQLSNDEFERARKMGSVIPFGQPILIGHHSEGRHRSHLKRIDNTYRRSFEASDKAEYYHRRAGTAEVNSSISSDNPEAVELYQKKLAGLLENQEYMKAVNKAWKHGTEALHALGVSDELIAELKANMPSYQHQPFPTYSLRNNSAEIRRVKIQLATLARLDKMEAENITFNGGELRVNLDVNRVQFIFDGKPPEETRSMLKHNGFKWSPTQGAWQRQRTIQAIRKAKSLIPEIEKTLN